MRKVILITVMSVLIVLLGYIVYAGLTIGNFKILSYTELDEKSEQLDDSIRRYEEKNTEELAGKQRRLTTQISEYEQQKQKYEEILMQKQTDLVNIDTANCYDVDFLWTRVGNYATQHGLDLEFNVSKNITDPGKSEYILTDLHFTTVGDYKEMADFIEDLEKGERLEFEIRDFYMRRETIKDESGKEKKILKSTFTVYSVALNKSTLTELTTPASTNTDPNATNTTTGTNTVNTTNTTNTVNNTTNTNS